jgi:hypothetical protein
MPLTGRLALSKPDEATAPTADSGLSPWDLPLRECADGVLFPSWDWPASCSCVIQQLPLLVDGKSLPAQDTQQTSFWINFCLFSPDSSVVVALVVAPNQG